MNCGSHIREEWRHHLAFVNRIPRLALLVLLGALTSCFPAPTWQPAPTYAPPTQTSSPPSGTSTTSPQVAPPGPSYLVVDGIASRHDSLTVSVGFYPDPYSVAGLSGGSIDTSYLGNTAYGACLGYAQANPNHLLTLSTPLDYLRLEALSGAHLTLVVLGPDGWRCHADTRDAQHGGATPSIEGSWPAGTYRVWVGTFGQTVQYNYSLVLHGTPSAPVTPAVATRELNTQTYSARYQSIRLVPGFQPDPQVLDGTSGAHQGVDATYLGQTSSGPCRGMTDVLPSHLVNLTGPFAYLRLSVEGQGDTTLLVHGPSGWMCNDDAVGLNPQIEGAFPSGMLRIWVGSYRADDQDPYILSIGTQPAYQETPQVDAASGAYVPRYQALALVTGFSPDPQTVSGVSGGTLSASQLGGTQTSTCAGYTELAPSHVLYLNSSFDFLRIDVEAEGDTTLAVLGPNGWLCADDSVGVNPRITGSFTSGTYPIWVGSYDRRERHEYSLSVTTHPARAAIRPTRPIRRGEVNLAGSLILSPGFLPDPQMVSGTAGGSQSMSVLGGEATRACNGFGESSPRHVLTLTEPFHYLRLDVDSSGDTTLMVEGPEGWYCNDDTVGFNPRLEGPFPSGTYRVWVGSYYPDTRYPYTLSITEILP